MRVDVTNFQWPGVQKSFPRRGLLAGQGAALGALVAVISLIFLTGCSRGDSSVSAVAPEKKNESRVLYGTNGETVVTLSAEAQKLNGLQTTVLTPVEVSREIKSFGRVMDASSLASLVADVTSANAASAASRAELERLETLALQTNASARVVQAAEASAARDQAQAEAARLKLMGAWGRAIADRKDLTAFVRSLSSLESLLVQLNFSPNETPNPMPARARIATLSNETNAIEVQFVGPATAVDPQLQARGFLYLLPTNSPGLAPGMAVTGTVELAGVKQGGVIVPPDALVRFNGAAWVYVQTSSTTFQRAEARLQQPADNGWFVREGLKPGIKIVTTGAQQLLSEEMNRQTE